MKKWIACLFLVAMLIGCSKPDPRERKDFIDTSDPSKVPGTMLPPPPTDQGRQPGATPNSP